MNCKNLTIITALLGLGCFLALAGSPYSIAQDQQAAPVTAQPSAAPAPPGQDTSGADADASAKPKFKKSRLTNDTSEATADKRKLLLTAGEDKAVDLDFEANAGAGGIAIGNPQIVATTLVRIGEKRQIVFKPLKAGETTVTIRDNDGTLRLIFSVRVTGSNLLRTANELRSLLRDIEGLTVRVVGTKIVVEGEVLIPADYGTLLTVIQDKAYADLVMNLTTLSPLAMQVLAKRIQDDVNTFAPNVKTRVVNGVIFMEGTVDNDSQAKRAVDVANVYMPELRPGNALEKDPSVQRFTGRKLIQPFILVNPPPPKKQEKLVRVTIHFVELSKDYNKLFGFKWQPGFSSDPQIAFGQAQTGATAAQSGASFSATLSSLIPKLQSAQAAGYARIIKTGTVIVRSGQPASFEDLTQFPYLASGPNGQVVPGKEPVGLAVGVTPAILGQSEDIQLDLKMSQTNVVGRAPAGTAPVTSLHKVETKIYVKSNESAAVAGVQANSAGTDFNKDDPKPGSFDPSSNTDALFTLLRSKSYRKQKSQFVVFVTPQIIENASEGSDDLKKNFRIKVK